MFFTFLVFMLFSSAHFINFLITLFVICRFCILGGEQLRHDSPLRLLRGALQFLTILIHNNCTLPFSKNKRGLCYLFLLIRSLHAVSLALEESPFCVHFVKCLRVFYRTIPKPFVCQQDVIEFLHFLCMSSPFTLISLGRTTEIFLELFKDDCPQVYAPRSLKHLSRVAVRSSLKKTMKMLPHSVRSLHIPRDLHDYLLCIEPLHM